jgi:formate-dependent nitrite reductase membrane component NrfD
VSTGDLPDGFKNLTDGRQAVPGTAGPGRGPVDAARDRLGNRSGRGRGGRRRGGRAEEPMVPDATFTSYYGRPVVKASPWEADIRAYLFLGGLAAGSSLLAAGADLTGRPTLRRAGRLAALGGLSLSMLALVHDLGRPERFVNMLRVIKPTSPMSVGTWILTAYAPGAVLAGGAEILRLLPLNLGWLGRLVQLSARPGGIAAAVFAPGVASYTAVLLSDTATPAWHDAHREMPFVFVSSAAAASGGLGMVTSPLNQAGPARRLAVLGAAAELISEYRMEQSMGLSAEALHTGTPGRLIRASKALVATGGALALVLGGRSRTAAALAGLTLLAGSICTRFGIFEAGQASAKDPKYTVVPQRERVDRRRAAAAADAQPPTSTDPGSVDPALAGTATNETDPADPNRTAEEA